MSSKFRVNRCVGIKNNTNMFEILYGLEKIAIVKYQNETRHLEMEILPRSEDAPRLFFLLKDFREILEKAKILATQSTKED